MASEHRVVKESPFARTVAGVGRQAAGGTKPDAAPNKPGAAGQGDASVSAPRVPPPAAPRMASTLIGVAPPAPTAPPDMAPEPAVAAAPAATPALGRGGDPTLAAGRLPAKAPPRMGARPAGGPPKPPPRQSPGGTAVADAVARGNTSPVASLAAEPIAAAPVARAPEALEPGLPPAPTAVIPEHLAVNALATGDAPPAATPAAVSHAFADTIAVPSGAASSASSPPAALSAASPAALSQPPSAATPGRTTVLPRLSVDGGAPILVQSDRERYEHEAVLGEGGMGEVLRAVDNDIQRTVAIKRLLPELREPAVIGRFVEEIRTVGQLEHPNIVPIHDVGVDALGRYFFVMKYVEGETLESIIERLAKGDRAYHARFTLEHRLDVFVAILEAIHYAHERGIVHRDIKPANIMVGPYGEVMVMDWGIAKRIRGGEALPELPAAMNALAPATSDPRALHRTQDGMLIGTPAYMSPEQAAGMPVDERSDVYSLCVLLYELVGLKHYLDGAETVEDVIRGVISREPPSIMFAKSPHQPFVPADIFHFLAKGLQKDPAKRFASVTSMLDRLRARKEGFIPIQCPLTFTKRSIHGLTHFVDRHPRFVLLATFLTPLLFVAAIVFAVTRLLA